MSFVVVIPSKTPDNLLPCISCIRAAHEKCEIVVVDDFSEEDSLRLRTSAPESVRSATWIKGQSPFVFATNINLGIAAAGDQDVLLLNDDACLRTPYGFSYLASIANEHQEYGIISAAITAGVGNPEQLPLEGTRLREAKFHTVVFIAVYIRRAVLDRLRKVHVKIDDGPFEPEFPEVSNQWLDEAYVDYGHEDNHACAEVRQMGLKLGVFDGCVVEHGVLPSTFRGFGNRDISQGMRTFESKWGCKPADLKFPHEIAPPESEAAKPKW